jgi:hypothetical protein
VPASGKDESGYAADSRPVKNLEAALLSKLKRAAEAAFSSQFKILIKRGV